MANDSDTADTADTLKEHIRSVCSRQGLDDGCPPGATILGMGRPPAVEQDPEGGAPSAEFEILGTLGEGGMGMVLHARQRSLDRDVAIKVLKHDKASEHAVAELTREARLSGGLEHPNIIPVHVLAQGHDRRPQMVMKRLEGISWDQLLDTNPDDREGAGPADAADAALERNVRILMSVCNAIDYAHSRGVLHCDIKPGNVMIGDFGEVVVLDWGVAQHLGQADETTGISVHGTPAFMAPEMVRGERALLTRQTDVYLLGSTLHMVLTGKARHRGTTLFAVLLAAAKSEPYAYGDNVPAELAAICNRACSAEPALRFPNVAAFRQALADWLQHRSAVELATTAHAVLDRLRELVSLPPAPQEPGSDAKADEESLNLKVHRLFSQCRFGFVQSLREFPDNQVASEGLQDALELMIEHELHCGDLGAAEALIADLPTPRPELQDVVAQQQKQRQAQEQAQSELAQLRWDQRFQGRDRRRAMMALGSGALWGVVILVVAELIGRGVLHPTPLVNLLFGVAACVEALVGGYFLRHIAFENLIFRQFLYSAWWGFVAFVMNRVLSLMGGWTFQQTLLVDFIIFSVWLGAVAATLDSNFWWIAVLAIVCTFAAALLPDYAVHIVAGLVFAIHVAVAQRVRPDATR